VAAISMGVGSRVEVLLSPEALKRRFPADVAERLAGRAGTVRGAYSRWAKVDGDWRDVQFDMPLRLFEGGQVRESLVIQAEHLREVPA